MSVAAEGPVNGRLGWSSVVALARNQSTSGFFGAVRERRSRGVLPSLSGSCVRVKFFPTSALIIRILSPITGTAYWIGKIILHPFNLQPSHASEHVTEEEILEKSKGRKIGEVQSLLKSINGVSSVKIDKSFFWVNSVPNDPNKVEIELKVEE